MDNEGKLNSSTIVLDVGAYMSFNADNGETGFGTREIVSDKSVHVHQYKDYFARKYTNESRTEYYGGEWVHGKREGNGTEVAASHSYTGQWLADKRNGYGRLAYPSGHIYTGYFQNNRYNGQGKMEYPFDRFFEGEWRKNQKWTGVMTDKKKDCNTEWENGKEVKNTC